MAGSPAFQIKRAEKFEESLRALIKSHFRRNPAGEAKFLKLLREKIETLASGGKLPGASLEPWPSSAHVQGWQLWKDHFRIPTLNGAAGQGRMIYLMQGEPDPVVVLLWIYTHAEFEKRPPDKALADAIKGGMSPPPSPSE